MRPPPCSEANSQKYSFMNWTPQITISNFPGYRPNGWNLFTSSVSLSSSLCWKVAPGGDSHDESLMKRLIYSLDENEKKSIFYH
jgi:hypothetical protein